MQIRPFDRDASLGANRRIAGLPNRRCQDPGGNGPPVARCRLGAWLCMEIDLAIDSRSGMSGTSRRLAPRTVPHGLVLYRLGFLRAMPEREVLSTILDAGIIPIVRTDTPGQALYAIESIQSAGIPVVEVAMTVPGALKILETASDRYGDDLVLGAGTVLDATTARHCMLAGAEFCVTPALDTETIEICNRYSKCVIPGALTPTEIIQAWNAGATMVKVFPVDSLGGPGYIKAIKAPLPQVRLVPTGGVNLENASDFFQAGASAVAVGSHLVNKSWLANREFARIETAAKGFLEIVAGLKAA